MQWHSKEALQAWISILPDDVLTFLGPIDESGQDAVDFIAKSLPALKAVDDYVKFISDNSEKFNEMGRARRIRFLAWCAAKFHSDSDERNRLFNKIAKSRSDEEESGSGGDAVGILFYEDIKAFCEAMGARAAALIVDENTLSTVAGVGLELVSDLELRGGRK